MSAPGDELQVAPSQCMISVVSKLSIRSPTAHTSSDARAATPNSRVANLPGLGLGTICHWVPSQCSMRLCELRSPLYPTAHTSSLDAPETDCRKLSRPGPLGASTRLHDEPSQCSTSGR